MKKNMSSANSSVRRLLGALVNALDPGREVNVENEILKHFPFARTSPSKPRTAPKKPAARAMLGMRHGALLHPGHAE
jgi:hypothetical protein